MGNRSMIIPLGTDAPIYHRPFATIALIAIHAGLFLAVPREAYRDFALIIGDGVHPLQWLTNGFLHTGIFGLLGDIIFLWTFGLVVEGKLGWFRFLLIYLLIGVVHSAALQILVPSEQEVAVFGTATIYGLIGICLVWAPRNEVTCLVWLRFTPTEFDLSILWFAAMYIALDVFTGGLSGVMRASLTNLSSGVIVAMALDHTFGAILGVVIAVAMLRLGWVDCEDWDLFAVLQGRAGRPKDTKTRRSASKRARRWLDPENRGGGKSRGGKGAKGREGSGSPEERAAAMLRAFRGHLELRETEAALAVYQKARRAACAWGPPDREWRDLIEALIVDERWDDAVSVMRDYVREAPEPSPRVRLKLAQVLIQKQGRPQQALKVLGRIPEGALPEKLEAMRAQLARRAEAMSEEGPLEFEEDLG